MMDESELPLDRMDENTPTLPAPSIDIGENGGTGSGQATVPGDAPEPAKTARRRRMRWLWLMGAVVLFLALVVVIGLLARGMVARAFYNSGEACYARGDHEQAIVEYGRAIQLMPDYAAAYVGRAMAYADLKDAERAIADLEQANAECAEAVAELDQAITLNPQDARAYRLRGDAYLAKGDLSRAMADYDRALKLRPGDVQTHDAWGLAQAQEEARAEAISILHEYHLDRLLTDQDDPRLWAAAIRKHGRPDCFGIGTEDRANEEIGMVNLESPCFGWADGKPSRAVSPDPKQSCFNNRSCLYVSRPSASLRQALVYKADFWGGTHGGSMDGQTMLWIRQLDGSWHETETSIAAWGIVWDW